MASTLTEGDGVRDLLQAIDGYKTYIVATCGVIFGILVIAGVVTPDQLTEWATVIGGAIVVFSAALGTIRDAIKKIGP